jgi:hypothetical protein
MESCAVSRARIRVTAPTAITRAEDTAMMV